MRLVGLQGCDHRPPGEEEIPLTPIDASRQNSLPFPSTGRKLWCLRQTMHQGPRLFVTWERDPEADAQESLRKAFEIIFSEKHLVPKSVPFDESCARRQDESTGSESAFPKVRHEN
jgi:hypothetical protein